MGGELENLPGETVLKLKVMNKILHNISIPLGHLVFALPAVEYRFLVQHIVVFLCSDLIKNL